MLECFWLFHIFRIEIWLLQDVFRLTYFCFWQFYVFWDSNSVLRLCKLKFLDYAACALELNGQFGCPGLRYFFYFVRNKRLYTFAKCFEHRSYWLSFNTFFPFCLTVNILPLLHFGVEQAQPPDFGASLEIQSLHFSSRTKGWVAGVVETGGDRGNAEDNSYLPTHKCVGARGPETRPWWWGQPAWYKPLPPAEGPSLAQALRRAVLLVTTCSLWSRMVLCAFKTCEV